MSFRQSLSRNPFLLIVNNINVLQILYLEPYLQTGNYKMKIKVCILLSLTWVLSCSFYKQIKENDMPVFVDPRDGQRYTIVRIGDQVWMAENLNYGKTIANMNQKNNGIAEKTVYENSDSLGAIHGGLYTWHEAMNWDPANNQGICPDGWHIPTLEEFQTLIEYLGADSAGQLLKSSKKNDAIPWDGSNKYGFSAIPSGVGYGDDFGRLDQWAVYWTSTEADSGYAWSAQLDNFWYPEPPKYKILYLGNYFVKENGFSIRCIKDHVE